MKHKRYSVEQIVAAVKQHELGVSATDIARKLGIAEQTFYRWKKQYGGLEAVEVRELKQLREENARLKRLVAESQPRQGDAAGGRLKKMVGASPTPVGGAPPAATLLGQRATRLRGHRHPSQHAPVPVGAALPGGATAEDPRTGAQPDTLRLQAHPYPAESPGHSRQQKARLSPVLRGRPTDSGPASIDGLSPPRADGRLAPDRRRRTWPGAWTLSAIRLRVENAFGRSPWSTCSRGSVWRLNPARAWGVSMGSMCCAGSPPYAGRPNGSTVTTGASLPAAWSICGPTPTVS